VIATSVPPELTRPVYTYTASAFSNAPDAISRVISHHRIGNHQIAVRVSLGICVGRHVPPHMLIVSDDGDPHFVDGSYVMTGGMTRGTTIVSVIRHVMPGELQRAGCTTQQRT
jgi:hypothetical protein